MLVAVTLAAFFAFGQCEDNTDLLQALREHDDGNEGAGVLDAAGAERLVREGAMAGSRLMQLAQSFISRPRTRKGAYDYLRDQCKERPYMCEAPFDCVNREFPPHGLVSEENHSDFGGWCFAPPQYLPAVHACAEGDLRGYADLVEPVQRHIVKEVKEIPKAVKWMIPEDFIPTVDAQYCMYQGICDDTDLNTNSSLDDAEAKCDEMFGGRSAWSGRIHMPKDAFDAMMADVQEGTQSISFEGGFHGTIGPHFIDVFAKLACQMGNLRCDAEYCKTKLCSPANWERFGHLAPKNRGQ